MKANKKARRHRGKNPTAKTCGFVLLYHLGQLVDFPWRFLSSWWLSHPSEKWWSSSDYIIIPTIGENNPVMFQSPPTSLVLFFSELFAESPNHRIPMVRSGGNSVKSPHFWGGKKRRRRSPIFGGAFFANFFSFCDCGAGRFFAGATLGATAAACRSKGWRFLRPQNHGQHKITKCGELFTVFDEMEVSSCFCLCCYIPWEQKRKLVGSKWNIDSKNVAGEYHRISVFFLMAISGSPLKFPHANRVKIEKTWSGQHFDIFSHILTSSPRFQIYVPFFSGHCHENSSLRS